MPPKVSDTKPSNAEALHSVEEETAAAARRIVATYSQDFFDGVTLMCMLGVEPKGLVWSKVAEEQEAEKPAKKTTKKSSKKTSKKATKKTSKKATKKSTKKATKKTAKKATKKTAKKA